jgi:H+/Cl- antiporter ClcA
MKEPPLSDQIKYAFTAILFSFVAESFYRLITNNNPKLNKETIKNVIDVLLVLSVYSFVLKNKFV